MSLAELIVLVAIAAICGTIGKALGGGTPGGLIASIALGFVGALVGPLIAAQLHVTEPLTLSIGDQSVPIVWSIIGATLFVILLHVLSKRS